MKQTKQGMLSSNQQHRTDSCWMVSVVLCCHCLCCTMCLLSLLGWLVGLICSGEAGHFWCLPCKKFMNSCIYNVLCRYIQERLLLIFMLIFNYRFINCAFSYLRHTFRVSAKWHRAENIVKLRPVGVFTLQYNTMYKTVQYNAVQCSTPLLSVGVL